MFNLILFGPPGSGKGTQSVKIADKFHLAHVSTGEIFRREIKNKTEMGRKVESIIERGDLVPDDMLIEILQAVVHRNHVKNGIIFDGFPRTCRQAEDLDKMLEREKNDCVSLVLGLDVDEAEVIKRLLKRAQEDGRTDDTEEVIRNRMSVYRERTAPLIEYYHQQGKYLSVKGVGSIDDIFASICRVIEPYIS